MADFKQLLNRTDIIRGEELTYEEYLQEYWSDQVTSPTGVRPRMWVAQLDEFDPHSPYVIFTWGKVRYKKRLADDNGGEGWETKHDAEMALLEKWHNKHITLSHNEPEFDLDKN